MLSAMSPVFSAQLREAQPEQQTSSTAAEVPAAAAPASAEGEDKQVSYETIARAALMRKESGAAEEPLTDTKVAASDAPTEEVAAGDQASEKQAPADKLFKMRVKGVSLAESVKIMLDYIY